MQPLLNIENLSIDFISDSGVTRAVKNVSFQVDRGETVAIVGESGSGKTVTALSILQLLPSPPANYSSGKILFSEKGKETANLLTKTYKELRQIRGNKIAMIFQEPMSSLNPVFTCGGQVVEALISHRRISSRRARQETIEWFSKVKLPNPGKIFYRYPHQLSGGQKQRVMIAMAMCCHPSLLICDEPTTALDVTVQKTILQLIRELQKEQNIGVIFITHDLGVVGEIADRTISMYKGEIVEQNTVREIFDHPQHPYTKALLACRPVNHPRGERLPVVSDFLQTMNQEQGASNKKQGTSEAQGTSGNEQGTGNREQGLKHKKILVRVENLYKWFPSKRNFFGKPRQFVRAVDNVSFKVYKGETLGLVGESGCGKTTLGRTLFRLIEPTAGKIFYNGHDLLARKPDELKSITKKDPDYLPGSLFIVESANHYRVSDCRTDEGSSHFPAIKTTKREGD